jgi:energy-coupling factor transport system substrate-specific component
MNHRNAVIPYLFIIFAGIVCNMAIKELAHIYPNNPLYMDSIGTVAATLCGGLVPGLLTGLLSNLAYCALAIVTHRASDCQPIFALCSMGTALAVYLFTRKKNKGLPVLDLALLAVIVTLVNSVIGGLISTFFFAGFDHYPSDYLVAGLLIQDVPVLMATILSRIPLNVLDKSVAVFAGYGLFLLARKFHVAPHAKSES